MSACPARRGEDGRLINRHCHSERSEESLIGPADAAGLTNQRCFASLNMTGRGVLVFAVATGLRPIGFARAGSTLPAAYGPPDGAHGVTHPATD
jgi:hypothetical protein